MFTLLILLVLAQTITCPHPVGHSDYCRDCGPCAEGIGDCDNDEQCEDGLTCVQVSGTDFCEPKTGKVSFAWDANDPEQNVVGYKIYYGKMSRHDESLDPEAKTAELAKRCDGYSDEVKKQGCIDSWYDYCTDPEDQMCDFDWFDYDTKINAGNVLTYTLTLPTGIYYLAATAYNSKLESKFSIELKHEIEFGAPGKPLNFKGMKAVN